MWKVSKRILSFANNGVHKDLENVEQYSLLEYMMGSLIDNVNYFEHL